MKRLYLNFDGSERRTLTGWDWAELPQMLWAFVRLWVAGRRPRITRDTSWPPR